MPYLDFDQYQAPIMGDTREYIPERVAIPERIPTPIAPPLPSTTPGGIAAAPTGRTLISGSASDLFGGNWFSPGDRGTSALYHLLTSAGIDPNQYIQTGGVIGYGSDRGEEIYGPVFTDLPGLDQRLRDEGLSLRQVDFGGGDAHLQFVDSSGNTVGQWRTGRSDDDVYNAALAATVLMGGAALAGAGGAGAAAEGAGTASGAMGAGGAGGIGELGAVGAGAGGISGPGISLGGVSAGSGASPGLYGLTGQLGAGGAGSVGLAGTGSGLGIAGAGSIGASLPSSAAIGSGLGAGIGSSLPAVGQSALGSGVFNLGGIGGGATSTTPPFRPSQNYGEGMTGAETAAYDAAIGGGGGSLMDSLGRWVAEHPDQALQLGSLLGGAVAGRGNQPGGGGAAVDQSGITALRPAAFGREYVAPPAGYRPGVDPEHVYFRPRG